MQPGLFVPTFQIAVKDTETWPTEWPITQTCTVMETQCGESLLQGCKSDLPGLGQRLDTGLASETTTPSLLSWLYTLGIELSLREALQLRLE